MRSDISVRRFRADEWRAQRELRLRALSDAPDAFARTHAEEASRPDAEWKSRFAAALASPDYPACAEQDARLVGLVYGHLATDEPGTAHLYSMWVEPAARRAGVGVALVGAVVAWARAAGVRTLLLEVTEGNAAARCLYERAGFAATDSLSPLREGSPLEVRLFRLEL